MPYFNNPYSSPFIYSIFAIFFYLSISFFPFSYLNTWTTKCLATSRTVSFGSASPLAAFTARSVWVARAQRMMGMHALFAQKTQLFKPSYVHLSVQDICSQIQDDLETGPLLKIFLAQAWCSFWTVHEKHRFPITNHCSGLDHTLQHQHHYQCQCLKKTPRRTTHCVEEIPDKMPPRNSKKAVYSEMAFSV